jgi:hypothetical protein
MKTTDHVYQHLDPSNSTIEDQRTFAVTIEAFRLLVKVIVQFAAS